MKPCPHCGTMLAASLVAAIRDPFAPESCPRQPKIERRVNGSISGDELVPGERDAIRMVSLALLGGMLERKLDALTGAPQ